MTVNQPLESTAEGAHIELHRYANGIHNVVRNALWIEFLEKPECTLTVREGHIDEVLFRDDLPRSREDLDAVKLAQKTVRQVRDGKGGRQGKFVHSDAQAGFEVAQKAMRQDGIYGHIDNSPA
jgi:hypothetical protein